MTPSRYSRILLLISSISLGIAAAICYVAAIRVFPIYAFLTHLSSEQVEAILSPLVIPITALGAVVLLLSHLYQTLSRRSKGLILTVCLLVPLFHYAAKEIDPLAVRYLFPSLTFFLYPVAMLSLFADLSRQGEERLRPGLHKAMRSLDICLVFVMTSLALLVWSDSVLILSVLLLLLSPIIPFLICISLSIGCFGARRTRANIAVQLAIALIFPLGAALRPFSFDISLLCTRIGTILGWGALVFVLFFPFLRQAIRKQKKTSSHPS